MALNGDHLMSLPREVQAHILSFMFKKRSRSIRINLDSAQTLSTILPDELLAAAKTCKSLTEATADVLGPHARVLNNSVWDSFMGTNSPNLHEWVAVLAPFVKAVSLCGIYMRDQMEEENDLGEVVYPQQDLHDETCSNNIKILTALSTKPVGLLVLDVKNLLHHRCREKGALLNSLVSALARSSKSLEQLGLRVSPVCIEAIEKVCLPNLQIVDLECNTPYQAVRDGEKEHSDEALLEMLKALSRHAERATTKSKKTTHLRELRLWNVSEVPRHLTALEENCASLFNSVNILEWNCPWDDENEGIGQFIGLFRNLESLHWRWGYAKPDDLRMIVESCRKLENIHLQLTYAPQETEMLALEVGMSSVIETFRACHGKLRSLVAETLLSSQLTILGETNPGLENLTMNIGQNNVGGLCFLLGNHCRKLQKLRVYNNADQGEPLDEEGWGRFSEAVKISSDELREISVLGGTGVHHEHTINGAMVKCMKEIIEFMGERARKIHFMVTVPSATMRFAIESLAMLMRTCTEHSRELESLHLGINHVFRRGLDDQEDERFGRRQILVERKRLLESLPRLKEYNFGDLYDSAKVDVELDN